MSIKDTRPELILGAICRGWAAPANERKEMDPDLAAAVLSEIVKIWPNTPETAETCRNPPIMPHDQAAPTGNTAIPDTALGLYRKYDVRRRSDPTGKHKDCEYYVLDLVHDKFAADALDAYSKACKDEYPQLAFDLHLKAGSVRMLHGYPSAPEPADVADCPVCGVAIYDEAAKAGYCSDHIPISVPAAPTSDKPWDKTPRTDYEYQNLGFFRPFFRGIPERRYVLRDFARQLEREINMLSAQLHDFRKTMADSAAESQRMSARLTEIEQPAERRLAQRRHYPSKWDGHFRRMNPYERRQNAAGQDDRQLEPKPGCADADNGSRLSPVPAAPASTLPLSAGGVYATYRAIADEKDRSQDKRQHLQDWRDQALRAIELEKDLATCLADAASDTKRLHVDKMKYFDRVIELEQQLAERDREIARLADILTLTRKIKQAGLYEAEAELRNHQRALLFVREALGLHRDSEDDLLEVIREMRDELAELRSKS